MLVVAAGSTSANADPTPPGRSSGTTGEQDAVRPFAHRRPNWNRPHRNDDSPRIGVGTNPFGIILDPSTDSAYVATVDGASVFDTSACSAIDHSGCPATATTISTSSGLELVLDRTTQTIYMTSIIDEVVTIIDARSCNARVTSGCSQPHHTVALGLPSGFVALDTGVHTLYASVSSESDPAIGLSLIDTTNCNGHDVSGCPEVAQAVPAGLGVDGVVIDGTTHTLYSGNAGDMTESVIDTTVCNARTPAGCEPDPPKFAVPGVPVGGTIDTTTNTLLVPLDDAVGGADIAGTLAMVDIHRCNAHTMSGCPTVVLTTKVGSNPIDVAINQRTRRAYVSNEVDSDVSVVDLTRCNARHPRGCQQPSPRMAIDFDGGALAVDAATGTIYAASQGLNTITVLDGRTCNADRQSGCRRPAPTTDVGVGAQAGVFDEHLNTIYVANEKANTISVIDPTICGAFTLRGCTATWPTIAVGTDPKQLVDDERDNTLYAGDFLGSTVSVVDTTSCNAHTHSGCGQTSIEVPVTGGAYDIVRDAATDTLYIANVNSNTLTLIDTSRCNARITTGCTDVPAAVQIGDGPAGLLVDSTNNTLYVSVRGETRVAAVDIATCNVRNTSGCAGDHPSIPISAGPRFLAVDPTTGSLYISTRDNSTIAIVDTNNCNAHTANGCVHTPPTFTPGLFPYGVTVDAPNHQLIVGNVGDSTVTTFDTRSCNARTTTGCTTRQRTIQAGGWPLQVTVDHRNGTLYISDNVDAQESVVPLRPRW